MESLVKDVERLLPPITRNHMASSPHSGEPDSFVVHLRKPTQFLPGEGVVGVPLLLDFEAEVFQV